MTIESTHTPLVINGQKIDLTHLEQFYDVMPNKGKGGQDLRITVRFSSHVYTERATHGKRRDIQDHRNSWRTFSHNRYLVSLKLPDMITTAIADDKHVTISRDYNQDANLMFLDPVEGRKWAVVFCFEFHNSEIFLSILSLHNRNKNQSVKTKWNKISYFARKCLYDQTRIP